MRGGVDVGNNCAHVPHLPTSFLLLCLEDASQVASTRARDTGYWGTSKPLTKQVTRCGVLRSGGTHSDWVPGAKLYGVERSNVGESDYRQGPSGMARGWSIRILRFSHAI